mmetsp:Transcript_87933/g.152948  ORF Transcript_87933/g.152948 Transcript_87933/m.152948 type:complete len:266 (-) Transcript_87933:521-1318(-)
MPEFQSQMQQELIAMEHLQGEDWWQRMEEVAHSISAELKGRANNWNGGIWKMEEALKKSSIRKLTGAAKKILAEHGEAYTEASGGYQRLHAIIVKNRAEQRRCQLIARVKEVMAETMETEDESTAELTDKRGRRKKQVVKLLQQMMSRKQTTVVKLQDGTIISGVDKVGVAMGNYWRSIMVSPAKTAHECEQFIQSLTPPRMWKEAMQKLWKIPSYDIVLTALEALDPSSAPGEDGIPAILYQIFSDFFVPRILQKIDNIARTGS